MAAPPQNNISSLTPESVSAADVTAPDPAVTDVPMQLETVTTALSGAYTGGSAGAYTLASYNDGSADILYFDYAAHTLSMLESLPKADETLRGRVPNCWGGVSPVLYGKQLYLFRLGGAAALVEEHGEDGYAAIMKLAPDGSGQTVLPLPGNWTFLLNSAVLCDASSLYFLMQDAADGATVLVKVDTSLSTYEELRRYEPGFTYSIDGFWEMGPVLTAASLLPPTTDPEFNTYWENQQFTLLAQGMNTGVTRQLSQWLQGQPGSMQGDTFYRWNAGDATVYALNADSGTETPVATVSPPDDYVQAQFMRTMLDGKLRLQFSTNRYTQDYAIDPATGEVLELTLDERDDNLTVCAEGGGMLLVRYGEEWVSSAIAPDFLPGAEVSPTTPDWVKMPQYALTDAASYFAGQRNLTEIQDLVYG